jgi:hypothetical protein
MNQSHYLPVASNGRRFNLFFNLMKTLSVLVLTLLVFFRASAQVSLEVALDQEQFLPGESVPVAVKITNRSGQQLHLGAEPAWLTFTVESMDGFVVSKNSEVPVVGAFDLESSQMATKHVDIAPYFKINKPGRYKLTATLRIKDWAAAMSSAPKQFDVINGAELWSQDFGVPNGTNTAPSVRKYMLIEANYLREQLRLYVQVSDAASAQTFRVAALGPMVSFSQPEAQVDRTSRLHVLWQAGSKAFDYCVINPDGTIAQQEIYDYFKNRPRLAVNENGEVLVQGGTRRTKPAELRATPGL